MIISNNQSKDLITVDVYMTVANLFTPVYMQFYFLIIHKCRAQIMNSHTAHCFNLLTLNFKLMDISSYGCILVDRVQEKLLNVKFKTNPRLRCVTKKNRALQLVRYRCDYMAA